MFYPTWRVFTYDRTVSKLTVTKNQLIEQRGILATKLCTHKKNINQINDIHLTRLPGETKVFEATDSESGMCAMLDGHFNSCVLRFGIKSRSTGNKFIHTALLYTLILQNVKCNIVIMIFL